jgi:hypothetical protein
MYPGDGESPARALDREGDRARRGPGRPERKRERERESSVGLA